MEQLSYGFWLLVAITAAYAFIAVDLWRIGNPQMAMVFGGYTFANIGLIWAMKNAVH